VSAGRPVLDQASLHALVSDVGHDAAEQFARRYSEMLGERLARLEETVRAAQAEEDTAVETADAAYVVALSLYSSSAMVGAAALADATHRTAELLRTGDVDGARTSLTKVYEHAGATRDALVAVIPR
jgi:HPt (histidine-containing phosphotransfer) domain-containing protein